MEFATQISPLLNLYFMKLASEKLRLYLLLARSTTLVDGFLAGDGNTE